MRCFALWMSARRSVGSNRLVRENPDPPMTVIARVGREGVECGVAGGTSPLRHETAGDAGTW